MFINIDRITCNYDTYFKYIIAQLKLYKRTIIIDL